MPPKSMKVLKQDASNWMHKPRKLQRAIWRELLRASVGEFFATFFFIGAVLAAIINAGRLAPSQGLLGATGAIGVGIAVAFAGTVTCYAFGDVSGAMFNPAITFGFLMAGKMTPVRCVCYIVSQCAGAVAATSIMYLVFPANLEGSASVSSLIALGVPEGVDPITAIFMEAFLTFCLVYVVFAVAVDRMAPLQPVPVLLPTDQDTHEKIKARDEGEQGLSASGGVRRFIPKIKGRFRAGRLASQSNTNQENTDSNGNTKINQPAALSSKFDKYIQVYTNNGPTKRDFGPLAIGFTLGFLAFLGSSVTGGGFNPARALATALISNVWNSIYVYIIGPLAGGTFAAWLHTFFFAFEGAALSAIPEDKAVKEILAQEEKAKK